MHDSIQVLQTDGTYVVVPLGELIGVQQPQLNIMDDERVYTMLDNASRSAPYHGNGWASLE